MTREDRFNLQNCFNDFDMRTELDRRYASEFANNINTVTVNRVVPYSIHVSSFFLLPDKTLKICNMLMYIIYI